MKDLEIISEILLKYAPDEETSTPEEREEYEKALEALDRLEKKHNNKMYTISWDSYRDSMVITKVATNEEGIAKLVAQEEKEYERRVKDVRVDFLNEVIYYKRLEHWEDEDDEWTECMMYLHTFIIV